MNNYNLSKKDTYKLKNKIFQAYFDCRCNKRNAHNALTFEIGLEKKLENLFQEVYSNTYKIGTSRTFIVFEPVQREIFAADFRDRIIHHYIIRTL